MIHAKAVRMTVEKRIQVIRPVLCLDTGCAPAAIYMPIRAVYDNILAGTHAQSWPPTPSFHQQLLSSAISSRTQTLRYLPTVWYMFLWLDLLAVITILRFCLHHIPGGLAAFR